MEENHTFQYTPAINMNESPVPTIACLPDTPSKVPDRPDRPNQQLEKLQLLPLQLNH